jgi:hypothetical protein
MLGCGSLGEFLRSPTPLPHIFSFFSCSLLNWVLGSSLSPIFHCFKAYLRIKINDDKARENATRNAKFQSVDSSSQWEIEGVTALIFCDFICLEGCSVLGSEISGRIPMSRLDSKIYLAGKDLVERWRVQCKIELINSLIYSELCSHL